jgi:hypothetical protein
LGEPVGVGVFVAGEEMGMEQEGAEQGESAGGHGDVVTMLSGRRSGKAGLEGWRKCCWARVYE